MIETQGEWLVTDEAEINLIFINKEACVRLGSGQQITAYVRRPDLFCEWTYTRSQVREALKPVEGQAYFWVKNTHHNDDTPEYFLAEVDEWDAEIAEATQTLFAVNALTIGKNCGELRKLYEWAQEE